MMRRLVGSYRVSPFGFVASFVFALVLSSAGPSPAQGPAAVDDQLLLDGAGIDASLLAKFVDGAPLDVDERPSLITVLGGLRQCSQLDLDRYSRKPVAGAELADIAARGRLWQVNGRLKSVTVENLSDEEAERVYAEIENLPADDGRRRIYRCEVELAGGPLATVYTLNFPKPLVGKAKLDESVSLQGINLKNAGTAAAGHPLIAARRLSWYPATPLGDLGMDYALYDDVRREARDLKAERECFYQLLAVMKKTAAAELLRLTESPRPFGVTPLFGTKEEPDLPLTMRGKLIQLDGFARRAVAVVVEDPDIVERFGIQRYYEIAMYTADSQNNPLLFNVLELPSDFKQGENLNERIRIAGTFLTGFYYQRDQVSYEKDQGIKAPMQKAPLLLGKTLQVIPKPEVAGSEYSTLYSVLFGAGMLVIAVVVWRMTRTTATTRDLIKRQLEPPPDTSLNDAPVEYRAKPDFSGLDDLPPADGK